MNQILGKYCPNCGCPTFGKECEWCGPADIYLGKERYKEICSHCRWQTECPAEEQGKERLLDAYIMQKEKKMTLIDLIQEFGNLSYDAGVHEREEAFISKADATKECFQRILRHIGKHEEAVSVPCPLCSDAEENERNFCWNCGRDLRNG